MYPKLYTGIYGHPMALIRRVRKVSMQTLHNFTYMGKKQEVGSIIFDEQDRMRIFVTYCESCRGKVLCTRDEAEQFSNKYRSRKNKKRTRIIFKIVQQ